MATVFKARQLSLDRIVAIKVLPKKMSENAEFVDRFYKEGKPPPSSRTTTSSRPSTSVSTPEGFHYFVMEYIEGDTLYDIMAPPPVGEGRKFSEAERIWTSSSRSAMPWPTPISAA